MIAGTDPAPLLSDAQTAILNAFIASEFDLSATAAAVNISIVELLAWHRDPAVQATLNDFQSLQDRADELQLAAARRDAVKELHGTLRNPDSDPIERRRAATALLRRGTQRREPNTAGRLPADARFAGCFRPEGPAVPCHQRELVDKHESSFRYAPFPSPDRGESGRSARFEASPSSASSDSKSTSFEHPTPPLVNSFEEAAPAPSASYPSEISNLKSNLPFPDDLDPLDDPALSAHFAHLIRRRATNLERVEAAASHEVSLPARPP